jgi:hypothetical protein
VLKTGSLIESPPPSFSASPNPSPVCNSCRPEVSVCLSVYPGKHTQAYRKKREKGKIERIYFGERIKIHFVCFKRYLYRQNILFCVFYRAETF